MTFRKGTSTILVKNSFLDSAREVEFLKKSVLKNNSWKVLPSVLPTRRGITVAKKNGIIGTLTKDISSGDRDWWSTLSVNNDSCDLGITRDKGEMITN